VSGLNAGGSYRPLIVEMALSTPNFLTCSLWAVDTVIAEEARGDGHHLRKLRRRRRKSSQPRLCQVWLHRGEGGKQVMAPGLLLAAKVRAFIDLLVDRFAEQKRWLRPATS
jgi:hypothetical protein